MWQLFFQVRVIKKRKEVKMDRWVVLKKISNFLVKESVLYHSWVKFEHCKCHSAGYMHSNLQKALEVTFTFLSISLKYSLDIFRTDEGQVTEKLSSLIPEHSQCSSDLKVPDPVSRQLSCPTAKGCVKFVLDLQGDPRVMLTEPPARKTFLNTAFVVLG